MAFLPLGQYYVSCLLHFIKFLFCLNDNSISQSLQRLVTLFPR